MATTEAGVYFPAGGDTFNPASDMERLARSLNGRSIIPVRTQTERDALKALASTTSPITVMRLDLPGSPLEWTSGGGWSTLANRNSAANRIDVLVNGTNATVTTTELVVATTTVTSQALTTAMVSLAAEVRMEASGLVQGFIRRDGAMITQQSYHSHNQAERAPFTLSRIVVLQPGVPTTFNASFQAGVGSAPIYSTFTMLKVEEL